MTARIKNDENIIKRGDIVDVTIFTKGSFENKPVSLVPNKMKLGIGLTKEFKGVLNIRTSSDLARKLRARKEGDKIEAKDYVIVVDSIEHKGNVK